MDTTRVCHQRLQCNIFMLRMVNLLQYFSWPISHYMFPPPSQTHTDAPTYLCVYDISLYLCTCKCIYIYDNACIVAAVVVVFLFSFFFGLWGRGGRYHCLHAHMPNPLDSNTKKGASSIIQIVGD